MEIIAALIIACSNLIQPTYQRMGDDKAMNLKKECIQRVSDCGYKALGSFSERKTIMQVCTKEVY